MNTIFVKSVYAQKVNDLAHEINKHLRQRYSNSVIKGATPEEFIKALDKELDVFNDKFPRCRPYHAYLHVNPMNDRDISININNASRRESTCFTLNCSLNPIEYTIDLYDQRLTATNES